MNSALGNNVTLIYCSIFRTFQECKANRFQDLDDLQSIPLAENELDLIYVVGELERLKITLPTSIKTYAPKSLNRIVLK